MIGLSLDHKEREFIKYLLGLGRSLGLVAPVRKAVGDDKPEKTEVKEPKPKEEDKGQKREVKTRFSAAEIKEMGLKWVTVHPQGGDSTGVPILVKDLGDEYMVVGGAGGQMNFTRFKKTGVSAGEYGEGKKPKKEKEKPPELTEEEYAEYEKKAEEAKEQKRETQSALKARVHEMVGEVEEMTDEQRKELERKALAKAKELHVSEEGRKQFVEETLEEHKKLRQEEADKAAADLLTAVDRQAGEEAMTGQPMEPPTTTRKTPEGKTVQHRLTSAQYEELKTLHAEVANAASYERSVKRALSEGGAEAARALELSYQPLSEEEQAAYFKQKHLDAEELRLSSELIEKTADPGRGMASNIAKGAAQAGAGIAAATVGTTVLDSTTAKAIGIVASAQVIAQYVAEKTGDPKAAAKGLREFIGKESAAKAGAAVHASEKLREDGLRMMRDARKAGLMSKAQATARVLQYGNEADRVLAEAMGSLETAAQVALQLERGAEAQKIVVPGRGSEAGTRAKAKELGLSNEGDQRAFSIRRGKEGWEIHVTPDGVRQLYNELSIEEFEADAEVQEIKARGKADGWEDEYGNPWSAKGQGHNVQLMAHQQANIKLWERQKNLLVTDEAGSGKTACALCGITHLHEQGKVKKALIVVPTTVLQQFGDEIKGNPKTGAPAFLDEKYHDSYQVMDTSKMNKKKRQEAYGGDQLITVITHDTMRNDFEAIKAAGFDCMTVDEAHEFVIRGTGEGAKGSKRAQKVRQLDVPYKMLMTGSPVRNDLTEFHSLCDWLQPGCLGTKKEFMAKYGKLASSAGLFDEALKRSLQQRLSGIVTGITLSTERTEGGKVLLEMKPLKAGAQPIKCREKNVWVGLSEEQAAAYREEEAAYIADRKAGKTVNPLTRDQHHKKTVNDINTKDHPKVQALSDILSKHKDENAVIFAHNTYSQETIIKGLGLKKGEFKIIKGPVPTSERRDIAAELSDPKSPLKYVICSDAANFGLNMQGGSVMVNYDCSQTYATHRQRIGREFRKGQIRDVSVYNLRTRTPYEQKAQEIVDKKKGVHDLATSTGTVDESDLYGIMQQRLQ